LCDVEKTCFLGAFPALLRLYCADLDVQMDREHQATQVNIDNGLLLFFRLFPNSLFSTSLSHKENK
jgi:hypothetical protein